VKAAVIALLLLGGLAGADAAAQAAPMAALRRGNGPEPSTLDAHRCPEVACGNILRDLYEGLVGEDADGRVIAGMAESWQLSADGRRWTFHLREGLHWSNGERLDAGQVVASFRRAFAPATAAPFAQHFDAVANASAVQAGKLPPARLGISAPDARTVVFQLTRSAALPQLLLLPIAYPVYLPALQEFGAQHTRPGHLVSNGAYRLLAWTPQASLTLGRNGQFRAPAAIARVEYLVTEDAASELQRFQAGGLDITETVPPQPLPQLRRRFGAQLRISPYLGSMWLGLNLTRPPLRDNLPVREALSLAIDRDKLTRYITGLGETPAYGVVPPGVSGYAPATLPWARAPQAQRERLARARYRAAGYSPARPLEIELRYNTSTPHRRMNLAIASMWREVLGAHVTLRNEEWKVFVGNRKQRVITQAFRGGWIADVDDARNFLANFESGSVTNWSGLADPGFDRLLHAADLAPSPALRAARLHQAEALLLSRQAVLPIYFYASHHLVRPQVLGFRANALDHHPSRFLRLAATAPAGAGASAAIPP
jgi:oligopeptide transport system substrate-binding protein